MSVNILQSIMTVLLAIVNQMVAVIMAPISLIIQMLLPDVDYVFTQVSAWIDYLTEYAGWVIDAFGLPSISITMVAGYYTFIVLSSTAAYAIKLAIRWYEAIKP